MMQQRKKMVLIIIAGLLVINLWQWWPLTEQASMKTTPLRSDQIYADDLRLAGYEVNYKIIHHVRRDLFTGKKENYENSKMSEIPVNRKIKIKAFKNTVVKNDQVKNGVTKFRLVAVLFKNGEKAAYLIMGDKDYSVKKDGEIEERYLVEEVTVSTVTLFDKKTQKSSIVTMQ